MAWLATLVLLLYLRLATAIYAPLLFDPPSNVLTFVLSAMMKIASGHLLKSY